MDIQTKILDKVVVVVPDIKIYGGRSVLTPGVLGAAAAGLPPKELASLGAIRVLSPVDIKPFTADRQQAMRACASVGPRFLNGFGVPEEKIEGLMRKLQLIQTRFMERRAKLLVDYEDKVEVWAKAHPDWSELIRKLAKTKDKSYVEDRLGFSIGVFRVQAHSDMENNLVLAEAEGLSGQLLKELAQAAQEMWDEGLKGKDRVTQRSIKAVRALRDKADGLSFLDSSIASLVAQMDVVLTKLPKEGPIDGVDLSALTGLVLLLCDPGRIVAHSHDLPAQFAQLVAPSKAKPEAQPTLPVTVKASVVPAVEARKAPLGQRVASQVKKQIRPAPQAPAPISADAWSF